MEIDLTASVLVSLQAIDEEIESGVRSLFGGKGSILRLERLKITSLKESDNSRKIGKKGTLIAFDAVHNVHQEVKFSVVCRVVKGKTKLGSRTWTPSKPVFEELAPGPVLLTEE